MMYIQVVFRYPGGKWQTYGDVVEEAKQGHALHAARMSHPNAHLSVIRGPSLKDITLLRERLVLDGTLEEAARPSQPGPSAIPPHELGPGGDRDQPYTGPVLPRFGPTLAAWATLAAKVQRGELGGPNDGAIRLGPQKEEGAA